MIDGQPALFDGYTEHQWEEIWQALQPLGVAPSHEIRSKIYDLMWVELQVDLRDLDEEISETLKANELIENLDNQLSQRGDPDDSPVAALYARTRPNLLELSKYLVGHVQALTQQRTSAAKIAGPSRNAAKPFQNDFQRGIAELWECLSGSVRYEKSYRRFFEAIAKPVYESEFGKSQGLSWSPSTFNSHVKVWKSLRHSKSVEFMGNRKAI